MCIRYIHTYACAFNIQKGFKKILPEKIWFRLVISSHHHINIIVYSCRTNMMIQRNAIPALSVLSLYRENICGFITMSMQLPYNQNHFTQEVNFTTTQRQHGFYFGWVDFTHIWLDTLTLTHQTLLNVLDK